MISRDDILAANPIATFLQSQGIELRGAGDVLSAHQCAQANHAKDHWCVTVDTRKGLWHCNDCGSGGTVIDWVMAAYSLSVRDAMMKLSGGETSGAPAGKPVEVAWYDYQDENGSMIFQVVRFLPKTFRQRHKVQDKWVWSMEGVRRVLYQLAKVIEAEKVIICEGEKDCDNLAKLGHVATCNVGGAKKWLDSYSDVLKGKTVYVWPDQDKPGLEHADIVIKSIMGKALVIYRVEVKEKDASDFIAVGRDDAQARVGSALDSARLVNTTDDLPIKSFCDLELEYQEHVKRSSEMCLDLGKWLPSFFKYVRPIVPGELVSILSATGIGKTAILQNIALKAQPMPILFFELELPGSLMFERFIQIDQGFTGKDIFDSYRHSTGLAWGPLHVGHLYFCTKSRVNGAEMERIINKAELKMGKRPAIVMVDYIGLMEAKGNSRYERVSELAESLKVIAKETNTIVIFASQVGRQDKETKSQEVYLHSAKDSGSCENSSGLVIGAWREGEKGGTMMLKILKNTKGHAGGTKIECNFDGPTLRITEKATIDPKDYQEGNPRGVPND